MGWFFSNKEETTHSAYECDDEYEDEAPVWAEDESEAEFSDYEKGQALARRQIDWTRKNYGAHGHSSFREAMELGGLAWHMTVEREEAQVRAGRTNRQSHLDKARGARSMYD